MTTRPSAPQGGLSTRPICPARGGGAAPSGGVAEIGVVGGRPAHRVRVHRRALPRIEGLEETGPAPVVPPLAFITLGGCASRSKGSHAVVDAVNELERTGREYRLV